MLDLGIYVSSDCSFEFHITNLNKRTPTSGIRRRCMVTPYHMKKDIQLIENVQRRATKQLPKNSKLPYSERLRQLDLPTLRYRRIRGDMIEVFKILKYYDSDPNQILQRHTSSATRGHSLKLAKKQSNSNLRL